MVDKIKQTMKRIEIWKIIKFPTTIIEKEQTKLEKLEKKYGSKVELNDNDWKEIRTTAQSMIENI